MNMLLQKIKATYHRYPLITSLSVLVLFGATITFATPPTTPYTPGETLDPTCAPGDTNCTVTVFPVQTGNSGKYLTTDGTTTSWATISGSGISSLNGLAGATQTFATGTSGSDFGISSVGTTHTFNIPTASGSARGLLSSSDWTAFNGKENVLTFSGPLSRNVDTISVTQSDTSTDGYLSSTDWNIFNDKVSSPISIGTSGNTLYTPGLNAGQGDTVNGNNIFFGNGAGSSATNASYSNFIGWGAGSGATNANTSNFIGVAAGASATDVTYSNFIGHQAGASATNAANSFFAGFNSGYNDSVNNTGSNWSILIGNNINTGGFSNSILLGSNASGSIISNTKTNQFMLADTITDVRWSGVEYTLPSAQAGGAGYVLSNDGSGGLSWAVDGSQWITTGSDIYYDAGNVSIGTGGSIDPNAKFDVLGGSPDGSLRGKLVFSESNIFYGVYGSSDGGSAAAGLGVWDDNTGRRYGVYSADASANNYFAGNTQIGTSISTPAAAALAVGGSMYVENKIFFDKTGDEFVSILYDPVDPFGTGPGLMISTGYNQSIQFRQNENNQTNMILDGTGALGLGNGGTVPDASSILDLTSTTRGFLAPRMSETDRDAIASPATGLQIYNTDTNALNIYDGSAWGAIGGGGSSPVVLGTSGTTLYTPALGAGEGDTTTGNNIFFGFNTGSGATSAYNSNFLGSDAGVGANVSHSNFFGSLAGADASTASYSNFLGNAAGRLATGASYSNFLGYDSGYNATNAGNSNFFGNSAGLRAANASNSFFAGAYAGAYDGTSFLGSENAANSIFIGTNAGYGAGDFTLDNVSTPGWSILIGDNTSTGGFSNSIALGANAINTSADQFALADSITKMKLSGVEYTLPSSQAVSGGYVLTNDGSGGLSWGAVSSPTSPIILGSSGNTLHSAALGAGEGDLTDGNNIFLGVSAAVNVTGASFSNFLGNGAGGDAYNASFSNFFGPAAGNGAANASNSNFFGGSAGTGANNAANSIFLGISAGYSDGVDNTQNGTDDSSILIGNFTSTGGFSNSILLGSGTSISITSNTKTNQFMLADTITDVRWSGVEYTLPSTQAGGAGYVLSNDGSGVLSWEQGSSFQILNENISGYDNVSFRIMDATGVGSVSIGNFINSFVTGDVGAQGDYSTAIGFNALASGDRAVAISSGGDDSSVRGRATGGGSMIFGDGESSGPASIGIGSYVISTGRQSLALGHSANATGDSSVAIGSGVSQGRRSIAFNAIAYSYGEMAFGSVLTSYVPNSVTSYDTSDRLFIIGDGDNGPGDMFTILKSGLIGVGYNNFETTTELALLQVNGSILQTGATSCSLSADGDGEIICTPSDQNLKKDITDMSYGLSTLMQLRPVSYSFIDSTYGTGSQIGFIAQELETLIPEVVTQGPKYKSVNYGLITSVITKAVQELNLTLTAIDTFAFEDTGGFTERLRQFFESTTNGIRTIFVKEVQTDKLCVGTTCVTESQLQQLLNNAGQSGSTPTPSPEPEVVNPEDDDNSEETVLSGEDTSQEEEVITEPSPEETSETTVPEEENTPEQVVPEPTPEPVLETVPEPAPEVVTQSEPSAPTE